MFLIVIYLCLQEIFYIPLHNINWSQNFFSAVSAFYFLTEFVIPSQAVWVKAWEQNKSEYLRIVNGDVENDSNASSSIDDNEQEGVGDAEQGDHDVESVDGIGDKDVEVSSTQIAETDTGKCMVATSGPFEGMKLVNERIVLAHKYYNFACGTCVSYEGIDGFINQNEFNQTTRVTGDVVFTDIKFDDVDGNAIESDESENDEDAELKPHVATEIPIFCYETNKQYSIKELRALLKNVQKYI
jgi:hypothetical protein